MPTKVKVKKSSTRVMGRACTSSEFVNLATSQGFDKRVAENAWRAMVEQARGCAYHRDLALPENISYGQIRDFQANGRPKKGGWGYTTAATWQSSSTRSHPRYWPSSNEHRVKVAAAGVQHSGGPTAFYF